MELLNDAASHDWRLWCRLCAKEDAQGNTDLFLKNDAQPESENNGAADNICSGVSLATAIERYFWVDICRDEELPKVLCSECFSRVISLINFSERVSKVQEMYEDLQTSNEYTKAELQAIRRKYGFSDENSEHEPQHQAMSEEHYSEPQICEPVDCEFETDENAGESNPLAPTSVYIKIENDEIKIENEDDYENKDVLQADMLQDNVLQVKLAAGYNHEGDNFRSEQYCDHEDEDEDEEDENGDDDEDEDYVPPKWLDDKMTDKISEKISVETQKDKNRKLERIVTETEKFVCPQCPNIFSSRYLLKIHSRSHISLEFRNTLPCPHCEKKFQADIYLQNHVKHVHLKERPFKCEQCHKAVNTKALLRDHMLTHSEEKPFECKVCNKKFKSKKRVRIHMESHDPAKHICAQCGLQLNTRSTYRKHMLIHKERKQFECDYCKRGFYRLYALRDHLIAHAGLKPYSCNFCGGNYASGLNVRLHQKKKHAVELAALKTNAGPNTYTRTTPKMAALKQILANADTILPAPPGPKRPFVYK